MGELAEVLPSDQWQVLGQFKLVKLQGEFVWHDHRDTDEVFLVLDGEMEIGFRDRTVALRAGELFVVPKGVEHITRAARECSALLIEPRGVVNTGDAGGALTAVNDVWVQLEQRSR